tara:strand:+ start:220 stop:693 length:474 start_codon:yes stop_codon:yes gene_type:complete
MDNFQKLKLQEMIKANDVEDQTGKIRELQHSDLIRKDLIQLQLLKKTESELLKNDKEQFNNLCIEKCNFLFNNYTDIFNKIKKDELDLMLFDQFLKVLKRIENEEIDQHQGSFIIGEILKKLYVDTALRRSANNGEDVNTVLEPSKQISWKEYKKQI